MRTRDLGATTSAVASVVAGLLASGVGCASGTRAPPAVTPTTYFRSPPLDYVEQPRSASDGEVLGANQRSVDDWMLANATSQRFAPGWRARFGGLHFEREHARAGHGVVVEAPACYPAPGGPEAESPAPTVPTIGERKPAGTALQAWSAEGYSASLASMAAQLRGEQSHWLRCNDEPVP